MNGVVSPVLLATTLSTIASMAACAYFVGFLRARRAPSAIIERSTTIVITSVTLPVAWFLGYVVGGNFGGSIASQLTLFNEGVVIPVGIGIGIFVVTSLLSCTLALVGLGVGILLQRVFDARPNVEDRR